MLGWFRRWRRRRLLTRYAIDNTLWRDTVAGDPLLSALEWRECERLRELSTLFLAEKEFYGAAGHELDAAQCTRIAAVACLLVLELGLEWYRGWYTIIVYPVGFRARHRVADDSGVVHALESDLSGEAWETGPVVLSWEDVNAARRLDGYNVVLHEFAHKLDMLDGASNGIPPLHRGMEPGEWTEAFTAAWNAAEAAFDAGHPPLIDNYALEAPEEFFAVSTEAFFEIPLQLKSRLPRVYEQLKRFYRQDPVVRARRA